MTGGFARPDTGLVAAAAAFSAATLHEAAGRTGALPAAIKPLAATMRACGPAFTVRAAPGDNLWLHRAIAAASAGDVLVVTVEAAHEYGYWGGIMTAAALARRLGGLVIDGCIRDGDELVASGFPVFARGRAIRGTAKRPGAPGALAEPLAIGGAAVAPGDLIFGDADGVVAIRLAALAAVLAAARDREVHEASVAGALRTGRTTLDIYGWE